MTSTNPAQCFACTRRHASSDPNTETPVLSSCDAYPEGIPFAFAAGADHRTARGDERRGLTFEQADTDTARNAFNWWEKTFAVAA